MGLENLTHTCIKSVSSQDVLDDSGPRCFGAEVSVMGDLPGDTKSLFNK